MNLSLDYFLSYHNLTIEKTDFMNINDIKNTQELYEISALILSANIENFEKYLSLDSFNTLLLKVSNKLPTNFQELNELQYYLIEKISLINENDAIKTIQKIFCILKKRRDYQR